MELAIKSFFNQELTKEQWEQSDVWLKFTNDEIPASTVDLSSSYSKVIERLRRQHNLM